MSIQVIIEKIKRWFGVKPRPCSLCPGTLDENYATICYRVSDDPEIQYMNICSKCMDDIEGEHEKAKKAIGELKNDNAF